LAEGVDVIFLADEAARGSVWSSWWWTGDVLLMNDIERSTIGNACSHGIKSVLYCICVYVW